MEFPDLGEHCSEKSCNKLDFLPMKCDACDKIFCSEHFSYIKHDCLSAHKNNVQVPVCPLCGEPVPTPRNVSPDQTVGQHIDQYCKSETKKIFTNRCTYKNCKKKELIPFNCSQCTQNFCLRHRHTADHECKGPINTRRNLLANKAEKRREGSGNNNRNSNYVEKIQGNMTEDEALAKALAQSIIELDETSDRNRRNARTVQVGATTATAQKDKCSLS